PTGLRPGSRERERRYHQRVTVESPDQLLKTESGDAYTLGRLQNLSESGCLVVSDRPLACGTDLHLTLKVSGYELSFQGEVRHTSDTELGIEFHEVRKGDRQVLQHLLQTLDEQQLEESFELEVTA